MPPSGAEASPSGSGSPSRDPPWLIAHSIQRSWMQLLHQNARPTTSLAASAAASIALSRARTESAKLITGF